MHLSISKKNVLKDAFFLEDKYYLQPQWKMGKKIQAAAYNGARTVYCVENQICIESST